METLSPKRIKGRTIRPDSFSHKPFKDFQKSITGRDFKSSKQPSEKMLILLDSNKQGVDIPDIQLDKISLSKNPQRTRHLVNFS